MDHLQKFYTTYKVLERYSSTTRVARVLDTFLRYSLDTRSKTILGTRTRSILELLVLVPALVHITCLFMNMNGVVHAKNVYFFQGS